MKYAAIILLALVGCLSELTVPIAGTLYTWHDEKGKVYIVDDIQEVPPRYRNQREGTNRSAEDRRAALRDPNESVIDSPIARGNYTVHLASFRQMIRANRYIKTLGKEGLKAYRWEVDLPEKGRWYRVCVGSFTTREQAHLMAANLKEEGLQAFVIRYSMPR